jgi:hypothetical protein
VMTVKSLIISLTEFPQDAEVLIDTGDGEDGVGAIFDEGYGVVIRSDGAMPTKKED